MPTKTVKKSIISDLISFDQKILTEQQKLFPDKTIILIGVDEVGRGPIAGPLCTAAVFAEDLSELNDLELLNDSKKVAKSKREYLNKQICSIKTLSQSLDLKKASQIDKQGIISCLHKSWQTNIKKVLEKFNTKTNYQVVVLVDGPHIVKKLDKDLKDIIQIPVVKGDSKSALIACASNLAKYKRDKYMQKLALKYPEFSWQSNVGYGTKAHYQAIYNFGLNKEHRKSFLKNLN